MKITGKGVRFDIYQTASPGVTVSSFTDSEGATLLIDTATLVQMYELCQLDLERRGGWAAVMERVGAPKDRRKQATPERTKRMERALKVLSTWAQHPPLDAREVRELCFRALKADEDA